MSRPLPDARALASRPSSYPPCRHDDQRLGREANRARREPVAAECGQLFGIGGAEALGELVQQVEAVEAPGERQRQLDRDALAAPVDGAQAGRVIRSSRAFSARSAVIDRCCWMCSLVLSNRMSPSSTASARWRPAGGPERLCATVYSVAREFLRGRPGLRGSRSESCASRSRSAAFSGSMKVL